MLPPILREKKNNNWDNSQTEPEEKHSVFTLEFSSIITIIFFVIVAIALAYIGGVMSGRHMKPEIVAEEEYAPPNKQEDIRPYSDNNRLEQPNIIPPEELKFARALRNETSNPPQMTVPPIATNKASAAKENTSEKKAVEAQAEAGNNNSVEKQAKSSEKLYDHIFQAGAFRDENSADKLRQTLEGYGLRTQLERDGKLFIVLIRLRGNNERAEEIEKLSRDLRLGPPILRSKREVNN